LRLIMLDSIMFFFQAEDGIRDDLVTGVQTCALPILRHHLLEAIVEQDDAILHKYLEEHELSEEEIRTVLRKATISGKVVPVLAGAAFKNKGVQALLDAVVDYLPAPVDGPAIQWPLPHHNATP